ncbi:MAG: lamin tail domain-containing protein, partial [Thermoplasmata archaeon]
MMQGISDNKTNAKINDKRARRGGSPKQRRLFSFTVSTLLVLSTLLLSISTQIPNASAGTVTHNVGELQVRMLTDHGRIWMPLQWPKTGTLQTAGNSGWGYMGLVVDQDGYDHNPGSVDIADCYKSAAQNYMQQDDFGVLSSIDMIIDDGNSQKSKATFQNIGTTQDANDILINQTCWTVKDKDWAILQWRVVNIKTPAADITGFCLGLEVDISHATASYGLGGDPGDEIDGYDAQDDIYWAQDDKGTTLGFGSAIAQDPITHYYSKDYHPADYDEYKTYWEDETWLYERLHAANNTVGASPGNRTTTVGWNQVNIPAGSSRTFTLVIAINSSFDEMKTAFEDAQYYYHTVASGFRITEFSDASSAQQRVEVFNFGRRTTDLNAKGYFLSVDGGTTKLVGNWDTNPLQSYEYAVFTLDPGENIGPEGGSLGLYQDLGAGDIVHVDSVSFGIFGPAPDPLLGESTARIWSDSQAEYIGKWTRASTPSFGEKNIVPHINPDPEVVLNEVMFYPSVNDGGYITIYNKMNHNVSLKDFYVVCDTVYQLSGLGDIILEPSQTYIIRHS